MAQGRVEELVQRLAPLAGLAGAAEDAVAAARLCHADLATATVTEMTALAGTIGRHLASASGAPPQARPLRRTAAADLPRHAPSAASLPMSSRLSHPPEGFGPT